MRIAASCAVALGLSSVLGVIGTEAQAQSWHSNSAPPMVAFSTINLLTNGDFSTGTAGWKASGTGMNWQVQGNSAVFQLNPLPGAQPSSLSFSQLAPKTIRAGNTICLRFQAQGNVPVGVALFDNMAPHKPLMLRKFNAPGDGLGETYTLAIRAPRNFGTNELFLKFYLGFGTGRLKLTNIRLLDQGQTPPEELPLTPETIALPEVKNTVSPKIESTAAIAVPEIKTPAPVQPAPIKAPNQVLDRSSGVNLLNNGDFANGDAGWQTWGQQKVKEAKLDNGRLTLQVATEPSDQKWTVGMKASVTPMLRKGTPFTVRFRLESSVTISCALQTGGASNKGVWFQTINPTASEKEYVMTGVCKEDLSQEDVKFELWLGHGSGTVKISDIQVLIPKS